MPTKLSVLAERREGIEIIQVSGEIDLSTAPRLGLAIEDAAAPGAALILDLTDVGFFDSSGARTLALADRAAAAQDTMLLIVPSEFVSRVLEIGGLEPAFRLHPTIGSAIEAARGIAPETAASEPD